MPTTLSKALIAAAQPPAKGQRIIYDGHRKAVAGFGLRITAGGTKSFILRYFIGGKERRMTIGKWGEENHWSLEAARKRAGEYRKQIDGKVDILEERRRQRCQPTVAEAVDDYCDAKIDGLASGKAVRSALERYLVKALGSRRLGEIRRRDVIAVVESIARHHGRQAALVLTYTKGLFAWAEDLGIIDANPAAAITPLKVNKRLAPRKRTRVLDDDEIRGLWVQAESCSIHRLTALCLKLILITGQRPGEVAGMRWDEIEGNTWTIPARRRGIARGAETDHVVALTDTALSLLDQAREEVGRLSKRRKRNTGTYVFETRLDSHPAVAAIDRAVSRYSDALCNKDADIWGHWRPHDLRRTMRAGLSACRVDDTVADTIIGLRRRDIESAHEQHPFLAERHLAMKAWEFRVHRILTGNDPDHMGAQLAYKWILAARPTDDNAVTPGVAR